MNDRNRGSSAQFDRRQALLLTGAAGLLAAAPVRAWAATALVDLYEAARAAGEKQVVVLGPPSVTLRNEFMKAFAAHFSAIEMAYSGFPGPRSAAKVLAEAKGGVFASDVLFGGSEIGFDQLRAEKLSRSFNDLIVVDEARNPKNWLDGELPWADPDHYAMSSTLFVTPGAAVNTDLVKRGEVESDADLLNPKWKGRIVANDPLVPGSAKFVFRRLYDLHGPDFITRLIKDQQLVIVKDLRQSIDWVAKGQHAVVIGASPGVLNSFLEKGVKSLGVDQNMRWKDKLSVSSGFGALTVLAKPANPAAQKLFVNWLLTREGQTALAKGLGYASRRVDVSPDWVPEHLRPIAGKQYFHSYTAEYLASPNTDKMEALVKSLAR